MKEFVFEDVREGIVERKVGIRKRGMRKRFVSFDLRRRPGTTGRRPALTKKSGTMRRRVTSERRRGRLRRVKLFKRDVINKSENGVNVSRIERGFCKVEGRRRGRVRKWRRKRRFRSFVTPNKRRSGREDLSDGRRELRE